MIKNLIMHKEALTSEGAQLWPLISSFERFYLAGGTALALQIGHRVSVDFDLFSNEEIEPGLLARVRRIFGDYAVMPSVNNPAELTAFVGSVKITFLHYPFPLLQPLVMVGEVRAASIQEIAAMKAYTIGRRTSLKDYVDMYALLDSGHMELMQVMEMAQEKYATEFNDRLFLEQLLSLDDIESESIRFLGKSVSKEELKAFFEARIRLLKL